MKQNDVDGQVEMIFKAYDKDEDGKVRWADIKKATKGCTGDCEKRGEAVFKAMDTDNSGYVDRKEVRVMLESMM